MAQMAVCRRCGEVAARAHMAELDLGDWAGVADGAPASCTKFKVVFLDD